MTKPTRGLQANDRPALLISELQRGVVEPGLAPFAGLVEQVAQREVIARCARLAASFRAAGLPVVHLHVVHRDDYGDLPRTSVIIGQSVKRGRMRIGTPDVDPMPGIAPVAGDIVHARTYSLVAFHGTELDTTLRHMGVTSLVMCGVSTNVAISGGALAGSDLGYQVIVPEDCIAAASAEDHDFIIRKLLPLYSTLSSQAEVEQALRERPAAAARA